MIVSMRHVLLLALVAAAPLAAQRVSGSITGFISDPAGAAIGGAAVTIRNLSTAVFTQSKSDGNGLFVVTNLTPGEYNVLVEAPGFRRFLQQKVLLQVDSSVRIEAQLQLGTVDQEVTVAASAAILKTEKTDVSQTISERELTSLPAPGRNLTKLYSIIPGVVENIFQIGPGENPGGFSGVGANGQFYGSNEVEIDGISDTACCFSNYQSIVPNPDSVQEMKLTTNSYDPEFGSAAGMVVQHVTRSGGNSLHGSAFWFNRNSAFFASDPFTEKTPGTGPDGRGLGPAAFKWNQPGFSLGGPLIRNRMFLFGDYQAGRTRQGAALTATVPNDAWRRGDFSGISRAVFDPLTGDPNGRGRVQFAGNQIPASRINPVARNLLGILPAANLSQNTDVNFLASGSQVFDQNQADFRYDANISTNDRFFARYTYFGALLNNPAILGPRALGQAIGGQSPQTGDFRTQHVALNYTHTFGTSLLSEVRAGFLRFRLDGYQLDRGKRTSEEAGIPGINTDNPLTQGLSGIDVQGPVGNWFMGIRSGIGLPRIDRTTNIQLVNNWTKIAGNHQFRWGVDIRRIRFDFFSTNASTRGSFTFCPTVTQSADVPASGVGMATFLLGQVCTFDRGLFLFLPAERNTRSALYWQDTWRVNRKLTVNYGARYSHFGAIAPRFPGQLVNFDPGSGDILFAGLGNVSRTANVRAPRLDLAPRLGIAYKILDKTVIRVGFGRSYFSSNFGATSWFLTSFFPVSQQQTLVQSNLFQGIFPISQGPPPPIVAQFPESGRLKAPPGTLLKHRPFDNPTEYVDSWNVTVEHQIGSQMRLSAAYVGNVGRHLLWRVNRNAAPPGNGPLLQRRPFFQQYGLNTTIQESSNSQNTNYNSLQMSVEKRYSHGYTFLSSLTWSKSFDQVFLGSVQGEGSVNPHDRRANYGVSTVNRPLMWTLSHTLELPYGPGLRFSGGGRIRKAVFAGWKFNGITTLASGFPVSPVLNDGGSLNADFGQRPDRVLGVDLYDNQSRTRWYNPAAFSSPVCCRWGNAGRSIITGPGLINADFAFWKQVTFKTPLNEQTAIEIRWENFNIFNNTNLGLPIAAVDSPIAGRILSLHGNLQGAAAGSAGLSTMRRMQFGVRLVF